MAELMTKLLKMTVTLQTVGIAMNNLIFLTVFVDKYLVLISCSTLTDKLKLLYNKPKFTYKVNNPPPDISRLKPFDI
jgi:hypothetical protein